MKGFHTGPWTRGQSDRRGPTSDCSPELNDYDGPLTGVSRMKSCLQLRSSSSSDPNNNASGESFNSRGTDRIRFGIGVSSTRVIGFEDSSGFKGMVCDRENGRCANVFAWPWSDFAFAFSFSFSLALVASESLVDLRIVISCRAEA